MQRRKETSIVIGPVKMRTADQRKYREFFQILIRFLYFVMASFGCVYWLFSMLELEVSMQKVFLTAGLSACLFLAVFGSKWKLRITLPVIIISLGGYIFYQRESLISGMGMLLNKISELVQRYYGQGLGSFITDNRSTDLNRVCCLAAFLLVMLLGYGILRRQRMGVVAVLSVILFCASLSLDCFPDERAVLLWICACLGLCAMGSKRRGRLLLHLRVRAGLLMFACSVVLLSVSSLWIVPGISSVFADKHEETMQFQKKMEVQIEDFMLHTPFSGWEIFSGFTWQGKVESGQLTNSSPGRTGRTALTVTLDKIPDENLYMRGFIGGIYEGDRWQEISDEDFRLAAENQWDMSQEEIEEARKLLLNQTYDSWNFFRDEVQVADRRGTYQVDLKEVKGSYGYLPYHTGIDTLEKGTLELQADGETVRHTDQLSYEGYFGEPSGIFMISSAVGNDTVSMYSEYVRQHYLYVPAEGIERLRELCGQMEDMLSEIAEANPSAYPYWTAEAVRELLASQCTYSTTLSPLPPGQDYTEYFFFDQKKGFCTHFASTGVLMLRMLGVPARYATGYVVRPNEFKKDAGADTFTAEVPDGNAHAWVEIYDQNLGWMPVELTPGYTEGGTGDSLPEDGESNEGITPLPTQTQTPAATPQVSETPDPPTGDGKGQDSSKQNLGRDAVIRTAGMILLILLAAAALCGLLLIRRYFLIRRRRRHFGSKSKRLAVVSISHEMYRMLRSAGYSQPNHTSDQEYGKKIQEAFPILEDGEFLMFIACVQKAKFSQNLPTEEEVKLCRRIYQKLERDLGGRGSRVRQLWWKFIRCYQL